MRKFTLESVPYMCADLNNQRGSRSRDHHRIQIYANIVGRYKFAPLVKLNAVCICLSIFSPELWPASGYFAGWGGAHLLAFKCQLPPPSSPALQRWPITCLLIDFAQIFQHSYILGIHGCTINLVCLLWRKLVRVSFKALNSSISQTFKQKVPTKSLQRGVFYCSYRFWHRPI